MKKSLQYGAAAAVMALAIIGTTLYVNTAVVPVKGQTNFLVMLTDPPNVPRGTTQLNVTYSGIQLHVVYSDGTSNWVAAQESGRVNLISLVNVTQTIATLNLPTGATVDKLQFTISSAEARISGKVYPVTVLSDQLVVSLRETKLNGTQTGALIDLRPTLVQIKAMNSTGGPVSYYVLVPSATAIVKSNVHENQSQIGTRFKLEDNDDKKLKDEYNSASKDVTITSSSLSVSGNVTTLTVTLKNIGATDAAVSGLTMQGDFNVSSSTVSSDQRRWKGELGEFNYGNHGGPNAMDRPDTIPFKISGSSLVPLFGDVDHNGKGGYSRLDLNPGQSVTLTFHGVIQLHPDSRGRTPHVAVIPIKGGSYTLRVISKGSQSFQVTAS